MSNYRSPAPVLGFVTATSIVVANMIGTGIFITTGLLVDELQGMIPVLTVWLLGGILALCGALSYGELSAALPRSGGEYHFLGRIYHPLAGFLAGWISLIVGFSAPIAAAAMAFGEYLHAVLPTIPPELSAILLVIVLGLLHSINVRLGGDAQNIFTILKIGLILTFIIGGFMYLPTAVTTNPDPSGNTSFFNPALAVGLIFVSFAYSGWNGATYIISEVRKPEQTIHRALFTGTIIVLLMYLALNVVFLKAVPLNKLSGVIDVGHVVAVHLFGTQAGILMSGLIALALISSVSAMMLTGPRVYSTAGQDYRFFSVLAKVNSGGAPVWAITIQSLIAILIILTATFNMLLIYIGFTLSLSAGLTVVGVMVLRKNEPDLPRPYKTWGYPVTPILFILLSGWMVIYNCVQRPVESLAGVGTIGIGGLVYYLVKKAES